MDINKAIILNDQYNNTLVAIENLLEHLQNCDIEADEFYGQVVTKLATMAEHIQHNKHKLIRDIEL